MSIYVVGSLNMDLVIHAPRIPEGGETISGSHFMMNPGGKGANQAVAAAKLGAKAFMVGCVGKAFGEDLIHSLTEYGVSSAYVRTEEVSSGIAVIVIAEGDNRIILDAGANARPDTALVDKALMNARPGDYLLVQLEIPIPVVEYALTAAKKKGMITVLNPAPAAELLPGILENCDYFMPNQSEAEFYTCIFPKDEESAKKCAAALAGKGVKNVVITMGAEGSAYVGESGYCRAECRKAAAVDTTAAGDTYVGGFAVGLSEGMSVQEAMDFASCASAITVTRRGAQQSIPTRAEVAEKYGLPGQTK